MDGCKPAIEPFEGSIEDAALDWKTLTEEASQGYEPPETRTITAIGQALGMKPDETIKSFPDTVARLRPQPETR